MTKVETPLVLRTDEGPVRTLTLNSGERFNLLSSTMIASAPGGTRRGGRRRGDTRRRSRRTWARLLRGPRSQRDAHPCG